MDAWRAQFRACRQRLLDDDDEDDVVLNFVLGLGFVNPEQALPSIRGGSRPGKSPNIERFRVEMHHRMISDYFCDEPVYGPNLFRRRYRMQRSPFLTIMEKVSQRDNYFIQKVDACGYVGLSSHQKCTSTLRMLCYGLSGDATDEYCRTSESTAMECMKRFCLAIREEFEDHHLRQPTREDFEKQLAINRDRGFPGMFASLDCMHYVWKNCPVAWQGDFGDKDGNMSIILEAVADRDLHIWHVFFGLPGSNNDLNVLDRSPLIHNMLTSEARDMSFQVNGSNYDRYYLLTDGIYPEWACFIQSIHEPQDEKRAYFAERQEAVRKDVERCFGVLQARFAILQNPSRFWSMDIITNIMFACCIIHNMIIEDEAEIEGLEDIISELRQDAVPLRRGLSFEQLIETTKEVENRDTHFGLRGDLIEHLWALKGAIHMA